MTPELSIRPASPADAASIQQIARKAWHAAYEGTIDSNQIDATVDSWYAPERLMADDIDQPDRPFFVATIDGEITGFVEAVPDDAEPDLAHLYRIYVAPEHWQEGIGRSLLERTVDVLRERDFDRLVLSVFADNDVGVAFYESMGFERIATTYSERFGARQYQYEKHL